AIVCNGNRAPAIDRRRHDETAGVVGVLTDDVDAARGAKDSGLVAKAALECESCLGPAHWSCQFSILIPGIRESSRTLRVTSTRFRATLCPAINRSKGPTGIPWALRIALILPDCLASSLSKGTIANWSASIVSTFRSTR